MMHQNYITIRFLPLRRFVTRFRLQLGINLYLLWNNYHLSAKCFWNNNLSDVKTSRHLIFKFSILSLTSIQFLHVFSLPSVYWSFRSFCSFLNCYYIDIRHAISFRWTYNILRHTFSTLFSQNMQYL